jgi:hypothetical protein
MVWVTALFFRFKIPSRARSLAMSLHDRLQMAFVGYLIPHIPLAWKF